MEMREMTATPSQRHLCLFSDVLCALSLLPQSQSLVVVSWSRARELAVDVEIYANIVPGTSQVRTIEKGSRSPNERPKYFDN